MLQAGRPISKWFPEIKEQADRCDWTSYGSKEAARDSILFQCDDKNLQLIPDWGLHRYSTLVMGFY